MSLIEMKGFEFLALDVFDSTTDTSHFQRFTKIRWDAEVRGNIQSLSKHCIYNWCVQIFCSSTRQYMTAGFKDNEKLEKCCITLQMPGKNVPARDVARILDLGIWSPKWGLDTRFFTLMQNFGILLRLHFLVHS